MELHRQAIKSQIASACFVMFFAQTAVSGFLPQAADRKVAAFSLAELKYFHRFTKDDQHEYTPAGQEDLNAWTDMVTLQFYRKAKDGEALAATANAVLENYKANKALVVKTYSVPAAKDKPAEHLIVVIFGRPEFIEVAFSRFRMHEGVGAAVIYSHRIYGKNVGNTMSAWLEKNGPTTEGNLMKWDAMPKLPSPK
jgi:hypothetical protein